MKLKLDENIPLDAVVAMRRRVIDVDTVADEELAGATDPAVIDAARAEGRMLVWSRSGEVVSSSSPTTSICSSPAASA